MTTANTSGLGKRLREVVQDDLALGVKDFKRLLGKYPDAVYAYFEERTSPNLDFLSTVSSLSGVSLDWIATGQGPRVRGLDKSALHTAVSAAVKIVESARAQGKQHQPEDVVAFIVDTYESVIKDSLDGNIPRTDSEQISPSKEAPADARDRKANS